MQIGAAAAVKAGQRESHFRVYNMCIDVWMDRKEGFFVTASKAIQSNSFGYVKLFWIQF